MSSNIQELWSKVFEGEIVERYGHLHDFQIANYEDFFGLSQKRLVIKKSFDKVLKTQFPINIGNDISINYLGCFFEEKTLDENECIKKHLTFGKVMSIKLELKGNIDITLQTKFNNKNYFVRHNSGLFNFDVIPTFTYDGCFLISSNRLSPLVKRRPIYGLKIENNEIKDPDLKYNLSNMEVVFLSDYIELQLNKLLKFLKKRLSILKPNELTPKIGNMIASHISKTIYECLTDPHVCPPINDTNPISIFSQKREISHINPFGLKGKKSEVKRRHTHLSHYGRLCPLETPESLAIGLTLHLARGAFIDDRILKSQYMAHNLNKVYLDPKSEEDYFIGICSSAGANNSSSNTELVRHKGQITIVNQYQIIYRDAYAGHCLGYGASLIPFIQHNDPIRSLMGSKNMKQALILKDPESPLIRTGIEKEITEDDFRIGINCLVAYMPWFGYNYEDGIVISEELTKRFTSIKEFPPIVVPVWGDEKPYNKKCGKVEPINYLTEEGMIYNEADVYPNKVVVRLHKFNDLIDTVIATDVFREEKVPLYTYGKIAGIEEVKLIDFDKICSPEVLKGFIKIYVKEERPLQVGDKLMGRHGNKGVVSKILPSYEMPYFIDEEHGQQDLKSSNEYHGEDKKHTHIQMILNPHGVISRMNLGQLMETHIGLVLTRGSDEYKKKFNKEWMPFEKVDMDDLSKALKQISIVDEKGKTKLYYYKDKKINEVKNNVVIGYQYIMKLDHMVEDKYHARNTGGKATITGQPLKGRAKGGGMRFGQMEVWALEAHVADSILAELFTEKSDKASEDENMRSLNAFVYYLRGLGISLEFFDDKNKPTEFSTKAKFVKIQYANDDIMKNWSKGIVSKICYPKIKRQQDQISFEKGSLYDQNIFGDIVRSYYDKTYYTGKDEMRMGIIELAEPIIHPVFAYSISTEYFSDIKNSDKLPIIIALIKRNDLLIIKGANRSINKKPGCTISFEQYEQNRNTFKVVDISELYLSEDLQKKYGISEIINRIKKYFIKYLPIIPISLRPYLYDKQSHKFIEGGLNTLYKNVIYANNRLTAIMKLTTNDLYLKQKAKRLLMVEIWKLFFKGDKVEKIKSIKDLISGKKGLIRHSLLGKRCDYSARSVIVPDPEINIDEVVIPYEIAKVFYEHNDDIKQQLTSANGTRITLSDEYVLVNRAPSLHKYNVQAFKPIVEKNIKAIKVNPAICQGYNADFDGDQVSIFLLNNPDSKKEANEKLLPQNNLISEANGGLVLSLSLDIKLGLYLMFENNNNIFDKVLGENTNIDNLEKKIINYIHNTQNKDEVRDFIKDLLINAFKFATEYGMSFGMFDLAELEVPSDCIKEVLNEYYNHKDYNNKIIRQKETENDDYKGLTNNADERIKFILGLSKETTLKLNCRDKEILKNKKENPVSVLYTSGAKKDNKQMLQLVGYKGFLDYPLIDAKFPPVESNYFRGLHPIEYFISSFQAKSSLMDKKLKTAPSGYLTRKLVSSAYDVVICEDDCKTNVSLELLLDQFDNLNFLIGRVLFESIKIDGQEYKELIDQNMIAKINEFKSGLSTIKIRSPIFCDSEKGVCKRCYGYDLTINNYPEIGKRVGIIAGQSIGERLTQLSMRSYHTGTTAGIIKAFDYISKGFEGEMEKKAGFSDEDLPTLIKMFEYKVDMKHFEVILMVTKNVSKGISDVSMNHGSFLAAASFGYSMKILSKAAIEEKTISSNGLIDRLILGQFKKEE